MNYKKINRLEDFLQKHNVSLASIENSKREISQKSPALSNFVKVKTETDTHVLVSEIKGITRVNDISWFDILERTFHNYPDVNMNKERFSKILELLLEGGFDKLDTVMNQRAIEHDSVSFNCFIKGNERFYFQAFDGNHRVVIAKICGLNSIYSDEVTVYKYI